MILPANIQGATRPSLNGLSSASLFNSAVLPVLNQLTSSFQQPQDEPAQEPAPTYVPPSQTFDQPDYGALPPPPPQRDLSGPTPQFTPQSPPMSETPQIDPTQPLGARNLGNPGAGDLISFVKGFEGFNQNAYDDYGQTSIGYGTRALPGERSISEEEAQARLNAELATHRKRVEDLNNRVGYNFTPNQLDALTSFDYNTGRLEQLTDNGSRDIETIAQKIQLYNKAGGKPLAGLTRRRKEEAALFINGYPTQ